MKTLTALTNKCGNLNGHGTKAKQSLILSLLLITLSPGAQAFYPIEINANPNGMKIEYQASNALNSVILQVKNQEAYAIQCRAHFRNGPETPTIRTQLVAPEAESIFTASFQRSIIRIRIDLECVNEGEPFNRLKGLK
ncbi:hypothetical protein MIB92_02445 [Aestuariirhabdus sp. Z084]|uniref:hypothetical protein n=1 Tax=Aestuariirhabdus haliotis TaxID=2918751 RepID=UPI00201B3739|nr:hypothetical protein [Aestuariirhabdus haliotis]MCL6414500.1 hypothetical protein [Aestuariirhabdus haliotis]MCL6418518.1 hypothetical protein [Aestuariirhabdus haliotis]